MNIAVTYMSGSGNLFTVIDGRNYNFSLKELSKLAKFLCHSNQFNGVRTEGLIVIQSPKDDKVDFDVDFFNPDGSSGMMCGNGGRCAIFYTNKHKITENKELKFRFSGKIYSGRINDRIEIEFEPPKEIRPVSIDINGRNYNGTFVDIGTEHFVLETKANTPDSFYKLDITNLGKFIRNHSYFAPKGTNANFYLEWNGKILLRTYERGVEAETGACGTGAISTVLAYHKNNIAKSITEVIPTSKIPVWVEIVRSGEQIEKIILSGPAEIIGSQEVILPDNFMEIEARIG